MPTYVYECKECSNQDEVVCSIKEMENCAIDKCSECGGATVRVITNTNRHTDDTPWRKGHYNSKEDWR